MNYLFYKNRLTAIMLESSESGEMSVFTAALSEVLLMALAPLPQPNKKHVLDVLMSRAEAVAADFSAHEAIEEAREKSCK